MSGEDSSTGLRGAVGRRKAIKAQRFGQELERVEQPEGFVVWAGFQHEGRESGSTPGKGVNGVVLLAIAAGREPGGAVGHRGQRVQGRQRQATALVFADRRVPFTKGERWLRNRHGPGCQQVLTRLLHRRQPEGDHWQGFRLPALEPLAEARLAVAGFPPDHDASVSVIQWFRGRRRLGRAVHRHQAQAFQHNSKPPMGSALGHIGRRQVMHHQYMPLDDTGVCGPKPGQVAVGNVGNKTLGP